MSAIHSMTGSANLIDNSSIANVTVNISSVNGRYLEIFFKIPDTIKHLDAKLRSICQSKLTRGKVDCFISFAINAQNSLNIDAEQVKALNNALSSINALIPDANKVNLIDILNYPGVIKQAADIQEKVDQLILDTFSKALDKLVLTRISEGEKLKVALTNRLELIKKQVALVGEQLPKLVSLEREKLQQKVKTLQVEIDESRLEQEIALLAQKADVEEEFDRLNCHISEVYDIINKGGNCGKRLDFMMQELNRETNTLASKASNLDLTRVAVELKVLIEQMREQVQNIE